MIAYRYIAKHIWRKGKSNSYMERIVSYKNDKRKNNIKIIHKTFSETRAWNI